jgi:hypothetical protein
MQFLHDRFAEHSRLSVRLVTGERFGNERRATVPGALFLRPPVSWGLPLSNSEVLVNPPEGHPPVRVLHEGWVAAGANGPGLQFMCHPKICRKP